MRKQYLSTLVFFLSASFLFAQNNIAISEFIKVDQFGYTPSSSKVAVISNPEVGYNANLSFTAGTNYQVRSWIDNSVIFSGSPSSWNGGNVHAQSGDSGWWFDFSSVSTEGEYYVYDVDNNVRSYRFSISNDVYSNVLKASMRMFFYNRSSQAKQAPYAQAPWTDNIAFEQDKNTRSIAEPDNAALEKDMSGGWFDAGDFNKYVTFTDGAIHDLMWAYVENPSVFTDNWQIPESGNGLPDIIDEIIWELDWLKKMNNPDGSTHIKMGSRNYSENTNTPPSLNTDLRYYGPTCSAAEISVAGVFAHAAKILSAFPSLANYSQDLENRAITTWNYVIQKFNANQLDLSCDNGEIISGDADWDVATQLDAALTAAVHLFDLTSDQTYAAFISNNLSSTEQITHEYWSAYKRQLNSAFLLYTTLSDANTADVNTIMTSFTNNLGQGFLGFSTDDLYRAYMPNEAYHWGSNIPKAGFGVLNLLVNNYNIDQTNASSYSQKAEEQLHYFHGVNPLNITYLSNMEDYGAEKSCTEIYHQWFGDGSIWDTNPAPGYVPGGPNASTSVAISPPSGQPAQKSYLDFNTSNNTNPSWEITEPAIYYQALYVRLLANYASPIANCSIAGTSCDDDNPLTTNDVEDGFCNCIGDCPIAGISCDDGDPLTTNDQQDGACNCVGDCPLAGTPCDDGNPITLSDQQDGDCNCYGNPTSTSCEIVTNGYFDQNVNNWDYWSADPLYVNGSLSLTNITAGANPWDGGFGQGGITLEQGKYYTISFRVFGIGDRSIFAKIGSGDPDNLTYLYEEVQISTIANNYSFGFQATGPSTLAARVDFFFANSNIEFSIDNISLTEVGCHECASGLQTSVENGDFSNNLMEWNYWGSAPVVVNQVANIVAINPESVNPWDASLSQQGLAFDFGKTYLIKFTASAASQRDVNVKIGDATNYIYENITLDNTESEYSYVWSPPVNVTNGAIEFFVGGNTTEVYVDNVTMTDGTCNPSDCETMIDLANPIDETFYEAGIEIKSNGDILEPSTVSFHAGKRIILNPNFEVELGATFTAMILPCGN